MQPCPVVAGPFFITTDVVGKCIFAKVVFHYAHIVCIIIV
jgi:hypothetical protein